MITWTCVGERTSHFNIKTMVYHFLFFSFLLCVGILGVMGCCWFLSSLFLLAIMYVRYLTIVCWILSTSVLMMSLGICFHIIMLGGFVISTTRGLTTCFVKLTLLDLCHLCECFRTYSSSDVTVLGRHGQQKIILKKNCG